MQIIEIRQNIVQIKDIAAKKLQSFNFFLSYKIVEKI